MNRRIALIRLGLIALGLVGLVWFYRFAQGSVTVIGPEGSTISLIDFGQEEIIGTTKATIRGHDDYTVNVKLDQAETLAKVSSSRWHHATTQVGLTEPVTPTTFYQSPASSFAVQGSSIRLVNPLSFGIQQIDTKTNVETVIGQNWPTPRTANWINYGNAVLVSDQGQPMYLYKNRLGFLNINEDEGDSQLTRNLTYPNAVNDQGQLRLIFNDQLLSYKTLTAQPKVLQSGLDGNSNLYLSSKGDVLYVETPSIEVDSDEAGGSIRVAVYDAAGQVVTESERGDDEAILQAAWSPSGQQLLLLTPSGLYSTNRNLASPRQVVANPGNLTAIAWRNDDTALYVAGGDVWSLSITNNQANKLTRSRGGQSPLGALRIFDGQAYYALSSTDYTGVGTIYSFKLPALASE